MNNMLRNPFLTVLKKIPNVVFLLAAMVAVCAVIVPGFLSKTSLTNILFLSAITGIVVVGETIVMIAGGIDLSASGLVSFGGVLAAKLMVDAGWSPWVAGILAVFVGFLLGVVAGWFIGAAGAMPFIITFAMQAITCSLALVLSNAVPISGMPKEFINVAKGSVFGIPSLFVLMLAIVIFFWLVMKYTRFGANVYSVGGNAQVAHLEGIKVLRIKIMVYGISAGLSALAGVLYAARQYVAMPVPGSSHEFNAITAAVVGGVAFTGGKGNVVHAAIGVLVVTALRSALGMLSVSSAWQMFATGLIVIMALMIPQVKVVFERSAQKAKRKKHNSSSAL